MVLKRRVERLERTLRVSKGDSDGIVIVIIGRSPEHESKSCVKIDGAICFTGTSSECNKWIDENLGAGGLTIVIGGNRASETVRNTQ